MPKGFYAQVIAILRASKFEKMNGGKGSHEKWQNVETGRVVIVPRSKSRHTANEVLKQAGLPKQF